MTTINDDVDQFEHYRYRIEAKLIPKRGGEYETIELTQAISELRIVKHYDEQVMPYYRLTCAVSVEDATAIQAAWRTGHVYITMKKMKALRGGGGGEQREEAVGAEYIKDGEFRILVCDGAPPPWAVTVCVNVERGLSPMIRMYSRPQGSGYPTRSRSPSLARSRKWRPFGLSGLRPKVSPDFSPTRQKAW